MAVTGARLTLFGKMTGTTSWGEIGHGLFNKAEMLTEGGMNVKDSEFRTSNYGRRVVAKAFKGVRHAERALAAHERAISAISGAVWAIRGLSLGTDLVGCFSD